MIHINSSRAGFASVAAALVLLAAWQEAPPEQPASSAPPAAEAYKLVPVFKAGQQSRIQLDFSADLDIVTRTKQQDTSMRTMLLHRQEEFVQEILNVQDGMPSSMGVTCVRSTFDREGTAVEQAGAQTTALAGQRMTLKRVQDSYQVEVAPSGVDQALLASLGRWMNFTRILPSEEKNVGDFWSVNSASLLTLFEGTVPVDVQGEMVCKLVNVVDGRAELSLSGTVRRTPQAKKDSQAQLTLTGSMIFDMSQGQIQSVKLTGDLEITQSLLQAKSDGDEELGSVALKSRKFQLTATFTPE